MGYDLVASSSSEHDVERIIRYYIDINAKLARQFLNELKATRRYIQNHPEKIQVRYSDVRIAFLKRFPIGVHFKISDETIFILAILGTSEDPKKWDVT